MMEDKSESAKKKEHFIPEEERPNLDIDLDQKVGDLTVRELSQILGRPSAPGGQAAIIKPVVDTAKRLKDRFKNESKDLKDIEKPWIKDIKDLAEVQRVGKQKEDFSEKGFQEDPNLGQLSDQQIKKFEELIKKLSELEKELDKVNQ